MLFILFCIFITLPMYTMETIKPIKKVNKEEPLYTITQARKTSFGDFPISPSSFQSNILYVILRDVVAIYNTNKLTHHTSLSLAIKAGNYIPDNCNAAVYNNNKVLYCAQDKNIGIYPIKKSKNYFESKNKSYIEAHKAFVTDIVALDSDHVGSISWDMTAKVWDMKTQQSTTFKLGIPGCKIVSLSPQTFITFEQTHGLQNFDKIRLFDIRKPTQASLISLPKDNETRNTSYITTLCPLAKEHTFLVGDGSNNSIQKWDIHVGKWLELCKGLSSRIQCLQVNNFDHIIALDLQNNIYVWDPNYTKYIQKKKLTCNNLYKTFSLNDKGIIIALGSHGMKKLELNKKER